MPWIPHFWASRDKWRDAIMGFEEAVQYILDHGEMRQWGRKPPFPYLDLGEWRYWSMPDPIEKVQVINRQLIEINKAKLVT